jgi:hypothetical protein
MMFGKQTKCSEIRFVSVEEMYSLTASCNTTSSKLRSDTFIIIRILGQLRTVERHACFIRLSNQ